MEGQFTQSLSTGGLPGKTEDELNRAKEEEEMRRTLMATVLDSAARERCTSFHSSKQRSDLTHPNRSIADCTR